MDWFLYDNGIRHERVKLQTDDWGTSSINFFFFILMSGYFTKIEMLFLKAGFW